MVKIFSLNMKPSGQVTVVNTGHSTEGSGCVVLASKGCSGQMELKSVVRFKNQARFL